MNSRNASHVVRLSQHVEKVCSDADWPLIAQALDSDGKTVWRMAVRRCSELGRHLVYGERVDGKGRHRAGQETEMWMTDLLIAVRATAKELGNMRLLGQVLDRLPTEDWTFLATEEDVHRSCAITVRTFVDGRHVVYGVRSDGETQQGDFRVSHPLRHELAEDIRKVASAVNASWLGERLVVQLG